MDLPCTATIGDVFESRVLVNPNWPKRWLARVAQLVAAAQETGRLTEHHIVVFSSGSVGVPRGVLRDLASWAASAEWFAQELALHSNDQAWIPGPVWSSLFAHARWHCHRSGVSWSQERVCPPSVTVAHCTPAWASQLLTALNRGALPNLRIVAFGGDRLPDAVFQQFAAHGVGVLEYYGSVEQSFVGYRRAADPFTVCPGVQVQCDDDGQLWSRSGWHADGPLDLADVGTWRVTPDGWASVGDTATSLPDGTMEIFGRRRGITTGGHTIVAADVERVVHQRIPGARAVAVGVPCDRLGQRLALLVAGDVTGDDVRAAFADQPPHTRPGPVVIVPELPTTSVGKPDYTAIVALFCAPPATADVVST